MKQIQLQKLAVAQTKQSLESYQPKLGDYDFHDTASSMSNILTAKEPWCMTLRQKNTRKCSACAVALGTASCIILPCGDVYHSDCIHLSSCGHCLNNAMSIN